MFTTMHSFLLKRYEELRTRYSIWKSNYCTFRPVVLIPNKVKNWSRTFLAVDRIQVHFAVQVSKVSFYTITINLAQRSNRL